MKEYEAPIRVLHTLRTAAELDPRQSVRASLVRLEEGRALLFDLRRLEPLATRAGLFWRELFPDVAVTWEEAAQTFMREVSIAAALQARAEHCAKHSRRGGHAPLGEALEVVRERLRAHVALVKRQALDLETQLNLVIQYECQGHWSTADERIGMAMNYAYECFDGCDWLEPLVDELYGPAVREFERQREWPFPREEESDE